MDDPACHLMKENQQVGKWNLIFAELDSALKIHKTDN